MVMLRVTEQVVDALGRAESLFATADDAEVDLQPLHHLGPATDQLTALDTRGGDWSGAAADQHRDSLASSVEQLGQAAATDSQLAAILREAVQAHDNGHRAAGELLSAAHDLPDQLQQWAELPATDLAALRALRAQLAGMQQLMARQQAASSDAATRLGGLDY
jgi:hypothetical protein